MFSLVLLESCDLHAMGPQACLHEKAIWSYLFIEFYMSFLNYWDSCSITFEFYWFDHSTVALPRIWWCNYFKSFLPSCTSLKFFFMIPLLENFSLHIAQSKGLEFWWIDSTCIISVAFFYKLKITKLASPIEMGSFDCSLV